MNVFRTNNEKAPYAIIKIKILKPYISPDYQGEDYADNGDFLPCIGRLPVDDKFFVFFSPYARRSVVQSTEFNLQMIAGTLGQELTELDMLTKWCATNLQIYGWLSDESYK